MDNTELHALTREATALAALGLGRCVRWSMSNGRVGAVVRGGLVVGVVNPVVGIHRVNCLASPQCL